MEVTLRNLSAIRQNPLACHMQMRARERLVRINDETELLLNNSLRRRMNSPAAKRAADMGVRPRCSIFHPYPDTRSNKWNDWNTESSKWHRIPIKRGALQIVLWFRVLWIIMILWIWMKNLKLPNITLHQSNLTPLNMLKNNCL